MSNRTYPYIKSCMIKNSQRTHHILMMPVALSHILFKEQKLNIKPKVFSIIIQSYIEDFGLATLRTFRPVLFCFRNINKQTKKSM